MTEAESGRIQRLFLFSGNLLPARIRADARFLIVRATPRTLSRPFSHPPFAQNAISAQGSSPVPPVSFCRSQGSARGGNAEEASFRRGYDENYETIKRLSTTQFNVTRLRRQILLQITHRFFLSLSLSLSPNVKTIGTFLTRILSTFSGNLVK